MASFNTVAGCVLASALFAMVVGKVSNAVVHPHKLDKPAIAVADEAPTHGRRRAAPRTSCRRSGPSSPAPMSRRARRSIMKQCFICHTVDKGGANKVGPNQWDIVGRKKASHEGFSYSSALQAKGGEWTYEDINHMIFKPRPSCAAPRWRSPACPRSRIAPT